MNFPLDLRFKLLAIASQIYVRDAGGRLVMYVRQKAFKLKEAITVYADEEQTRALYRIDADRVIDIAAQYRIEDTTGRALGSVKRRGLKSLWRAQYEVSRGAAAAFVIQEENPWVKVLDGLVGEIPVIGMLTGYMLHPAYKVTRTADGATVFRVVKQPALFEGRYRLESMVSLADDEEQLAVLSILMMLILERDRG